MLKSSEKCAHPPPPPFLLISPPFVRVLHGRHGGVSRDELVRRALFDALLRAAQPCRWRLVVSAGDWVTAPRRGAELEVEAVAREDVLWGLRASPVALAGQHHLL